MIDSRPRGFAPAPGHGQRPRSGCGPAVRGNCTASCRLCCRFPHLSADGHTRRDVGDGGLRVVSQAAVDDPDRPASRTVVSGHRADDLVCLGNLWGIRERTGRDDAVAEKSGRLVPSGSMVHKLWIGIAGRSTYSQRGGDATAVVEHARGNRSDNWPKSVARTSRPDACRATRPQVRANSRRTADCAWTGLRRRRQGGVVVPGPVGDLPRPGAAAQRAFMWVALFCQCLAKDHRSCFQTLARPAPHNCSAADSESPICPKPPSR